MNEKMRGNNYLKYFRYTLDDLKKSSDRKLFDYISFFAGGGGSSAGYKLAGGDCKFVNEFQQVAVDTYLANWPETPHHICGDIKAVSGQQIISSHHCCSNRVNVGRTEDVCACALQ